jgi:hypothetical protein
MPKATKTIQVKTVFGGTARVLKADVETDMERLSLYTPQGRQLKAQGAFMLPNPIAIYRENLVL